MSSKVVKLVKIPILSIMNLLSLFFPGGPLRKPARECACRHAPAPY
jgi:hypothetical protein